MSIFCTQLYFFKRVGLILDFTCASEVDPCSSWLGSVGVPGHNQLQPPHIQDLFFVLFCPSPSFFFSLFCVAFLLLMVEDYPQYVTSRFSKKKHRRLTYFDTVWSSGGGHFHNGLPISNVCSTSFRSCSVQVFVFLLLNLYLNLYLCFYMYFGIALLR